jgi:Protein of unknown function (DUF2815)
MNKVKFSKELVLQLTTPKATVMWANLGKPNTKFSPEGVYDVTVLIGKDDFLPIKTKIESLLSRAEAEYKATYKKKANIANTMPFREDVDKETGEETGLWQLKAKLSAKTSVNGTITDRRPVLVDSKLKPLSSDTAIGKGSIVRVNMTFYPYYVPSLGLGISAKLSSVQVIELKAWAGNNPLKGFDVEAAGFEGEGMAVSETPTSSQTSDDEDF